MFLKVNILCDSFRAFKTQWRIQVNPTKTWRQTKCGLALVS